MTQDFSLMKLVLNCLKIIVTVKALWLVVILLLFFRDCRGLLRRNAFELLVVAGSVLMILVIGFNGERSLWPANLASIVVFVREFDPGKRLSRALAICLIVVLACNSVLVVRIRKSFDRFEQMYLGSKDGVTIHERVNCGPFARFFFQSIYTWQTTGSAPMFFARYHGRHVPPKALTEEMHDTLYVRDEVCVSKNRMHVAGDFYTTSTINAIVSPIADSEVGQAERSSAFVEYAPPHGLAETIRRNLAQSNPPPVCDERHPVVLKTDHGAYLLISKRTDSEGYIKGVALKDDAKSAN